ncbi:Fucoxanthin-chlorophyll a-c binding protein A, chloroplastic [Seminavis robusta]|uniref:Fucoxanthin-chlorophyll a-c binding protein A, chloroplastic n=1 Tax=Seminavis robusta TaxID=568900 RepID=A0A9N8H9P7_9STRA|nr:Fucoxanthin-chlorophyll a-c binding protein A, chloroplastic [Seminavis robusta]|eukprot:Sro263_g102180.1 Fucoxanthin-chlorophyll a-c binding protein A, chloroplastic (199) ;mRNA; f:15679-16485
MRAAILSLLLAGAAAFAPAQQGARTSVALNAEEFSKSIPFLVRPEKLDGSMAGDMGFDPMRLSDIQTDLTYARWAELKHGRMCMLAICGIVTTQLGIHLPGEQFATTDIFAAPASVGFAGNLQVFLGIGTIELMNFYKHYDGSEPGELPGWEPRGWDSVPESTKAVRKEQEIVHCRLAMIAFTGAIVQSLLFNEPLLG